MGVDLKLLPLIGQGTWAAHDILRLERRSGLWPQIEDIDSLIVPDPLYCYEGSDDEGESKYGPVTVDSYGEELRYTTAGLLCTLADRHEIRDNWQNKAVWAYLAEMPPNWPIVLYWC